MRGQFPDAHIDDLIKEHAEGTPISRLAAKWRMSSTGIRNALHRAGIETKRPKTPDEEIVAAYVGGASELAVSKMFGIARSGIRARLIKAGVEPRSYSGAQRLANSQRPAEYHKARAASANAAARGRKASVEERTLRATTVQAIGRMSKYEAVLHAMLNARGIATIPQEAVGPYNCDLGAFPVAVEVWGGKFHWSGSHMAMTPKRFRYLMDRGWHVLVIEVSARHPLRDAGADYVAAYIQEARRDETRVREYRVIRGAGEFMAGGSADDDEIAIIPALTSARDPVNGQYKAVPR